MKYDSVLDQQSISGKIVSLILCVWKPCYMKSGHICEPVYVLVTYAPEQMLYLRHFAYVSHTVIECASYVLHL